MIEEDKGGNTSSYGFIPLMVNASKFQIGCLNADIHNQMMIYVRNYVVTEGNKLLSDKEIEMPVVLCINSDFMEFMRSKCGNLSRQKLNVTIVRSDGKEQSLVGFKLISQMKSVLLCTMIYISDLFSLLFPLPSCTSTKVERVTGRGEKRDKKRRRE